MGANRQSSISRTSFDAFVLLTCGFGANNNNIELQYFDDDDDDVVERLAASKRR